MEYRIRKEYNKYIPEYNHKTLYGTDVWEKRLGTFKVALLPEEWNVKSDDEKKKGMANGTYEELVTTIEK